MVALAWPSMLAGGIAVGGRTVVAFTPNQHNLSIAEKRIDTCTGWYYSGRSWFVAPGTEATEVGTLPVASGYASQDGKSRRAVAVAPWKI